tara:strand:- start:1792 stop:2202 length:411 start_codon:yes stop_codon:yes gene_type:complete
MYEVCVGSATRAERLDGFGERLTVITALTGSCGVVHGPDNKRMICIVADADEDNGIQVVPLRQFGVEDWVTVCGGGQSDDLARTEMLTDAVGLGLVYCDGHILKSLCVFCRGSLAREICASFSGCPRKKRNGLNFF